MKSNKEMNKIAIKRAKEIFMPKENKHDITHRIHNGVCLDCEPKEKSTKAKWEEKWDKSEVAKYIISIEAFAMAHGFEYKGKETIKSVISSLLSQTEQEIKERILKKIEELRKNIRCSACDGSKCNHTLGCKQLTELEKSIKVNKFGVVARTDFKIIP